MKDQRAEPLNDLKQRKASDREFLEKSSEIIAIELLKSVGMRLTETRLQMIQTLQEQLTSKTALEIYELIQRNKGQKILDLTTVYRCLDQFEKLGLVESEFRRDRTKAYIWSENRRHEHFVVCKSCFISMPLPGCEMGAIHRLVKKMGFSEVSHKLELLGLCQQCS